MNKQDYADRREKIKNMLLEGKTYDEIIAALHTSRSTIADVSKQLVAEGLKLPAVSVQFTGSATGELLKKKKKGNKEDYQLSARCCMSSLSIFLTDQVRFKCISACEMI